MHCPACNGRLIYAGHVPVYFPLIRLGRMSDVLTCTNCTATTEVDEATRRLVDYPGLTLRSLKRSYPGLRYRQTARSLRGGAEMFRGKES